MPETKSAVAPEALLQHVMETYRRAWETRDAALVLELFTEDATYQENPFSAPMVGHEAIARYWQEATATHRDIRFHWHLVSRSDSLHVVEWAAEFTRGDSGKRIELRGVMLIELRGARIFRFREYWLRRENT
jgi:ketosteroid isomerase-like protein